jgi:hypothetical protein
MSRHQQAGYNERAMSRILEPVLQQTIMMKNSAAAGNGHGNGDGNGNGNGGSGHDRGNGKSAWGHSVKAVEVNQPSIQLNDNEFGKY